MAIYEYEHEGRACGLGKAFEWEQAMSEAPLSVCPRCGAPVKKLVSSPALSIPRTNADLKSQGFAKLVRRDKGVYENVTATGKEKRIVNLGDQSTYPDLKRRSGGD